MKKRINTLYMLVLSLALNHAFASSVGQIVISADGSIQQAAKSPAKKSVQKPTKKPVKKVTKKGSKAKQQKPTNSDKISKKTPNQALIITMADTVTPLLPATNTITQTNIINDVAPTNTASIKPSPSPSPSNKVDIAFTPDTSGKTFRLLLKTTVSPSVAIISTNGGFFLIMDKKYSFQLPELSENTSFINKITPIDDPKLLILKFTVDPYIYANFERNDKKLYLTFFYRDAASIYAQPPTPALLILEEKQWPNITISPLSPEGKTAFITLDNDAYYVYMTNNPDGGYQHLYRTPYFETVATQQGLAIRNFSTKTRFAIENKQLQINHPTTATTLTPPLTAVIHFQNIFDVHPSRNMTRERSALMDEKKTLTPPYSLAKQLQWAWVDLTLNLSQEAKVYLQTAAEQYPKVVYNPLYKALLGMAYFLNQEYTEAQNCWKTLPNTLEIAVWKQLAASALGQFNGIDQLIYMIKPVLENYPPKLQEVLIQQSLKTAENLHNLGAVHLILGETNNEDSIQLKWIHSLYQAKILFEKKDFNNCKFIIKNMHLRKDIDQASMELVTESEFLKALIDLNLTSKSPKEIIEILKNLRFKWRGGSLEYRISQELIRLLESEKRYSDALVQLCELKRLFPSRSGVEQIDIKIQNFYIKYFQNTHDISPLKVIQTYGDFLEFIPEGKIGDDIVKIVAEQFERVDLLDEAAELLSRNQAKKPDSPEKIEILFKIVDIHMRNQKYDAARAILTSFPYDIATIAQKSKAIIRQAEALLNDKKKDEALALLDTSTDPAHSMLAAKIYAQNKQWRNAAEKLCSIQYLIDAKKDPESIILILNELAVMYFMDNQTEKLEELAKNYKDLMAGQQNFEFFTRPTHNNIKQRAEADIAIKDIENVADFIKRELEQPTLGSDKPIVTEKSATVEQNGAKIENGASEKDATVNTLKKPGV